MQTFTLPHAAHSLTLLPLYGSLRLDYEVFSYFVVDRWEKGLIISSPGWLSRSRPLTAFDLVKLHLVFKQGVTFYTGGIIKEVKNRERSTEQLYWLQLTPAPDFPYCNYVNLDGNEAVVLVTDRNLFDLFIDNIKECVLLKKGMLVYVKHLSAYFSRIIGYDYAKYSQFSRFFFQDIVQNLSKSIEKLKAMHQGLIESLCSGHFALPDSFQTIHELLESEVNLDLLNLTFREGYHLPYIVSVKQLEDRMCNCYNLLLLIYEALIREKGASLEGKLAELIENPTDVKK